MGRKINTRGTGAVTQNLMVVSQKTLSVSSLLFPDLECKPQSQTMLPTLNLAANLLSSAIPYFLLLSLILPCGASLAGTLFLCLPQHTPSSLLLSGLSPFYGFPDLRIQYGK